jgi:aldose 1-epimerase
MPSQSFGRMPDGTEIVEVEIAAGNLSAKIITYGAVIRDLRWAGIDHPLVLGFDDLDSYLHHSPYFGAVAGRCANRTGGGRLPIDGKVFQLSLNERGRTHLHGGFNGFGKRAWRLAAHDGRSVTLRIGAADGEEGYPGNLEAEVKYTIEAPGQLRMEASATTDAPTAVNLAQHSYFNLDDSPDILGHHVQVLAEHYTPVDADLVPTGEIAPVAGTPYDLRAEAPIGRMVDGKRFVYDINYAVDRNRAEVPRRVARLHSPRNGMVLDVASTEPGVQFYDGVSMNVGVPGLGGRTYRVNGGCCFEAQVYPDGANHADFPSPILRPGETYRQTTVFAFSQTG